MKNYLPRDPAFLRARWLKTITLIPKIAALVSATLVLILFQNCSTIQRTSPHIAITVAPQIATTDDSAHFFVVTDNKFKSKSCKLDKQDFYPCDTTVNYKSLSVGAHIFRVRVTEESGLQHFATYRWSVFAPASGTAILRWRPFDGNGLSGYMIHYGTAPGKYAHSIDVGLAPEEKGNIVYVVPDLTPNKKYYFVITGYNSHREEIMKKDEVAQQALTF